MRFATALSLEFSDGYVLYADPGPLPTEDHLHDWYPFWERSLGHPVDAVGVIFNDGVYRRRFEKGVVILNPPGHTKASLSFDIRVNVFADFDWFEIWSCI
jgi:hypothetical protein